MSHTSGFFNPLPQLFVPHAIFSFSLKEHLWYQPITSCDVHVRLSLEMVIQMLSQKRKHIDLLKGLADDLPEWWIQVLSTVLHQQEKGEYEGDTVTRSAFSTLSTLVNVTDWESIGEDLGFICLQFLPVATEVCCLRSLFYPHDLLFPHNRRAFHQILSGDNLFLLVRIAFINCDIWKHLLYNCFLTH